MKTKKMEVKGHVRCVSGKCKHRGILAGNHWCTAEWAFSLPGRIRHFPHGRIPAYCIKAGGVPVKVTIEVPE